MRIYWIDFLRVVSAIAVIAIHSVTNFYATLAPSTGEWWLSNFLMTTAKSSGPAIFVMIAGFILLNKKVDYAEFYKSRSRRILVPLVFWSILYSVFTLVFIDNSFRDFIWRLTIGFILSGTTYFHLWYLSMFVWLMLFTPALSKILQGDPLNSNDVKIFIIISIAFFSLSSLSNVKEAVTGSEITWFNNFGIYIFYFILGHLIPKHINSVKISEKMLLLIYISILAVSMLMNYVMANKGLRDDNMIIGDDTIFGFFAAIFFFTFITKVGPGKGISNELYTAAESSFGVYLIHPLILFFVSNITVLLAFGAVSTIFLNISATTALSFCAVHYLRKTGPGTRIT